MGGACSKVPPGDSNRGLVAVKTISSIQYMGRQVNPVDERAVYFSLLSECIL